eukprot:365938-Chlamydomonas_euryale.AAC.12
MRTHRCGHPQVRASPRGRPASLPQLSLPPPLVSQLSNGSSTTLPTAAVPMPAGTASQAGASAAGAHDITAGTMQLADGSTYNGTLKV